MEAVIDLIKYLKWKKIFIFYQEPERIEHLISFTNIDDLNFDFKFKFRLIDTANIDEWLNSISYANEMEYSHFIVDLDAKYVNKFLKHVILQYFYFIFKLPSLFAVNGSQV